MKQQKKRSHSSGFRKRLLRNKMALFGLILLTLMILVAIFADYIAPYGVDDQNLRESMMRPCAEHPFGTDKLGRDYLSRIIYGTRVSLLVGFIAVAIGVAIGGTLGTIAGYFGGKIDDIIMRFFDIFMAIPSLVLAICICAALGTGLVNTMIAVGLSTAPNYARVMRSAVLSASRMEYVEAARAVGATNFEIITRHIIPNSLSPLIVQASLGVAVAILSAASMSFIGLGVQPPTAEWGSMLAAGREYIRRSPYLVIYPGLSIMLTIFSLNLLGDGLRDALDPRLKR